MRVLIGFFITIYADYSYAFYDYHKIALRLKQGADEALDEEYKL
jgi:hypothetical protein